MKATIPTLTHLRSARSGKPQEITIKLRSI